MACTNPVIYPLPRTTLSVPSVVFAEASWYGSLRGGVHFGGGDTRFYDGASRWGIRGEAEASEGLTAIYRFEHAFSTSDGGQPNGRLGHVGLSGGFGTLTLGQIWSASYNHAGAIRDFGNWHSGPDTSTRVGNAVSYSVSNDAFSMQIDAIMDNSMDTGGAVDQLEFGMTVNLGEAGRVALAHTNVKDQTQTVTMMPTMQDWINTFEPNTPTTVGEEGTANTPFAPGTDGTPVMFTVDIGTAQAPNVVPVEGIMVMVAMNDPTYTTDGAINDAALTETNLRDTTNGITRTATGFTAGTACVADDDTAANACIPMMAFLRTTPTPGATGTVGGGDQIPSTVVPVDTYFAPADVTTTAAMDGDPVVPGEANTPTTVGEEGTAAGFGDPPVPTMDTVTTRGHKASHISAEFGLGGIAAVLGYTEHKVNDATSKTKITFIGAKGSLGDTGLDWGAFSRTNKNADGTESKPWTVGLSKSLGGGAWTYIEHGNNGNSGTTSVALGVSF